MMKCKANSHTIWGLARNPPVAMMPKAAATVIGMVTQIAMINLCALAHQGLSCSRPQADNAIAAGTARSQTKSINQICASISVCFSMLYNCNRRVYD